MSTTPVTDAPADAAATGAGSRTTFVHLLRSEQLRLWSVRSTWWVLGAAVAVLALLAAVAAAVETGGVDGAGGPPQVSDDPLTTLLTGATPAVLVLGVLGCLTGAREYTTRMVATTMVAVPRRWPVLAARAVVLAATVLPFALLGTLLAFLVGNAVLSSGGGTTIGWGDDGVVADLLGMGLWLTLVSLLGLGLGSLLRSTAASVGVLLGSVLVVPPIVAALLPDDLDGVVQLLPSNAASAFTAVAATGEVTLSGVAGVGVVVGWVVAVLGGAVVRLVRSDV